MSRSIAREGDVAWVDLMTKSPDRSAAFYEELFGWRSSTGAGDYRIARLAGRAVAGILPAAEGQPIEEWAVWLGVDDVDASFALALRHGATPLMEPFQVRDEGRCALVLDPAGACTGLWQGGRHAGLEARGVPGSPAWFELHVGDAEAARDFYRDVFGLRAVQMGSGEDFRYWTMHHGQEREAAFGLFGSGERDERGASAGAWVVYFATEDATDCVRRARRLGADLRFGPEPSVYGRMATLCDPLGAAFNLLQPERPGAASGAQRGPEQAAAGAEEDAPGEGASAEGAAPADRAAGDAAGQAEAVDATDAGEGTDPAGAADVREAVKAEKASAKEDASEESSAADRAAEERLPEEGTGLPEDEAAPAERDAPDAAEMPESDGPEGSDPDGHDRAGEPGDRGHVRPARS